jgi:NADH-quinone oxidoreductase subunit G
MPEIIIDDIPVQFSQKANIMDLAKSVGVKIPGFCYHPGLSVAGNCRMCMVEVGMPAREKDGSLSKDESGKVKISFMPKLQPGCYQEAADGMVIKTNTEKVITNRKYIMQFLLANHPLDCPECDQAGECVLQDFSFQYGFSKSRFFDEKRTFKKTWFSDVITPEMNRCIHCDRCSRFTKEIAHDYSFTRTKRGNKTELAALPGEKITHNYQGNMVDICPVGALTLTDFRFKSRTWFLKHSEGLCSSCGKGCNVVYAVNKDDNVLRIKPKFNKDVNSYWMCDYGRLRYQFYNQNRRRDVLIAGSISTMDSAVEKTWQLAREAKTIGVLASANETVESMQALANFVKEILKTPHVDFRLHSVQINNDKSKKAGEVLLVNDPYPNSEGALRMGLVPATGGMTATEMLKNPEKLDLLLVVMDDKFIENPDLTEALTKAFTKVKNSILFSPYVTAQDSKAAVIFPIPSSIEQSGTFINVDGIEQKFKAVITPPLMAESKVKTLVQTIDLLKQKGAAFTK